MHKRKEDDMPAETVKLTGKPVAEHLRENIKERVERLKGKNIVPAILIVRVGNKEDDVFYERSILKNCSLLGIQGRVKELSTNVSMEELTEVIEDANDDESIHGIMMFRPLPKHLDEKKILEKMNPKKDIDGMTPVNLEKVFEGDDSGFSPCTPSAVIEMLKYYDIPLEGSNVAVAGRSLVVGKPLAMLLLKENATVTICHSKTKNMGSVTSKADIVVAAIGKAKFMGREYFSQSSIVIDVGVNDDGTGKICGDVDYDKVLGQVKALTPPTGGVTDAERLNELISDETAAVIVQNPNFFGLLEDLKTLGEIAHKGKKVSMIASVNPISLALLKKPGELGVDVVVGEGQPLGIPLQFGGPYLGFMAVKKDYMRKLPGRIAGETTDLDGKRSYVLTLSAREQHIRREKATSNICSNQGLNVLAATVYMVTMGKEGLREAANQCVQKAHYAFNELTESGKYRPLFDKPFFMEFALTSDVDADKINKALLEEKIIGGYDLGRDYPQYKNAVLYAVTEKRTKEEIDKLRRVLEGVK
jgi:5,10-methylene-tetrahydrofolate dehydrogenase/methenyl tetrahydrofolate cyclohydrolase